MSKNVLWGVFERLNSATKAPALFAIRPKEAAGCTAPDVPTTSMACALSRAAEIAYNIS